MDKNKMLSIVETFDIANPIFNFYKLNISKVIELSLELKEAYSKQVNSYFSKKKDDFVYDLYLVLNEWMKSDKNINQAQINTINKKFEPMYLNDTQIQIILENYGTSIDDEIVKSIKFELTMLQLKSLSMQG